MTDRAYLRISLDTKTSGSIAKQRASTNTHARGSVVEYADESVSGSKVAFRERPAGSRLLDDLEPGDRVIVTKIDRVARNLEDLLWIVRTVREAGATITFTEQALSTEGPAGTLVLQMLGAVAEFEAALISERRRESLAAFREEGRHAVGRAPFGLRSVENPRGRGLVLRPDPDQAPVLREVVEQLLSGESQATLAGLVGMGRPAFSRLLRNERLAGVLGREEDGSPRLDVDAAVFSLVEWRRLQELLARPETKTWSKAEGIGGALSCSVCADRLYLNKASNPAHATYRCRKVHEAHANGAPAASVIARNADRHVSEEFLRRFGGLQVVEEISTDSSSVRDEALAVARMRLEAAQAALTDAETDDEEDEAVSSVRVAKRAVREAEALPGEVVTEQRATGRTFAEEWEDAGDDERTSLLVRVGSWIVSPGRLPLADKVRLQAEPDYLEGADLD